MSPKHTTSLFEFEGALFGSDGEYLKLAIFTTKSRGSLFSDKAIGDIWGYRTRNGIRFLVSLSKDGMLDHLCPI